MFDYHHSIVKRIFSKNNTIFSKIFDPERKVDRQNNVETSVVSLKT
jgi:hypothetical protein